MPMVCKQLIKSGIPEYGALWRGDKNLLGAGIECQLWCVGSYQRSKGAPGNGANCRQGSETSCHFPAKTCIVGRRIPLLKLQHRTSVCHRWRTQLGAHRQGVSSLHGLETNALAYLIDKGPVGSASCRRRGSQHITNQVIGAPLFNQGEIVIACLKCKGVFSIGCLSVGKCRKQFTGLSRSDRVFHGGHTIKNLTTNGPSTNRAGTDVTDTKLISTSLLQLPPLS